MAIEPPDKEDKKDYENPGNAEIGFPVRTLKRRFIL